MEWLSLIAFVITLIALAISLFALWAKWEEKPRLHIRLNDNYWVDDGGMRLVHLYVSNPSVHPLVGKLTYRQTAQKTLLQLEYSDYDGIKPKFSFEGRWSSNPAPRQFRLVNGERHEIFDPWLVQRGRFLDIVSDSKPEPVAIAVKFEGEEDCYGFTNESYEPNHLRDAKRKLPKGKYIVTATAISGEVSSEPVQFLLHNDGTSHSDLWLDIPRNQLDHQLN